MTVTDINPATGAAVAELNETDLAGMPERMPLHVVVTRVVVPVPVLRRRPPCGIFTPTRT